jgi:hypothetical protein
MQLAMLTGLPEIPAQIDRRDGTEQKSGALTFEMICNVSCRPLRRQIAVSGQGDGH